MKTSFYSFKDGKVVKTEKVLEPGQWDEHADWVEIHSSDRKKVAEHLQHIPLIKENRRFILNPENHTIPKTDKEFILQNFIVSRKDNIFRGDYLTLIELKNQVIIIIPETIEVNSNQFQPEHIKASFVNLKNFFYFNMIADVFAQNIGNMNTARARLNTMEEQMLKKPDKLSSHQVMDTRNDIRQIADIIEDQYVGLNILFSFLDVDEHKDDVSKLKEVLYGFKEINRIAARLEEKAESFRTQFMLIHQEEAAHKINILTILQAIFIPLTFIAGVYGMNFKYMPELSWEHGYYIVLGSFIVLAGFLLIFFKKNGWFD